MTPRPIAGILVLAALATVGALAGDPPKPTPPPASVGEAREAMGAALNHALFLLEMDTAAWAGTDLAEPALEKMHKKLKRKVDSAAYIQWKEGETWRILFFSRDGDEYRALVEVLLETPLTRQSKGSVKEHPVGKGTLLQGETLAMAKALLTGHARFQKEFEIYPKPVFNAYIEAIPDGTFRLTYVPADLVNEETTVSPNIEISVAKGGEASTECRVLTAAYLKLPTGAGKAPAGGHTVYWSEPLPTSADLLRLLLHPELGTVTALSPYARFRAKAGVVPTFLPWMVPLGGPNPDDEPWPEEGTGTASPPPGTPTPPAAAAGAPGP